ncbi:MAG: YrzE family protein [Oscillospiraceae bacterium]|nr:YrzE family protein [Oscillospiraceae bacterium]
MKQTKSVDRISLLPIAIGTSIACVFSFAAVFLGALLISKEYVGEGGSIFFQIIVYFLSGLLGSFVTGRFTATNKLVACGITVIAYCAILLGSASLFFEGISPRFWIIIVAVLLAFSVTMLWALKPRTARSSARRKIARR